MYRLEPNFQAEVKMGLFFVFSGVGPAAQAAGKRLFLPDNSAALQGSIW